MLKLGQTPSNVSNIQTAADGFQPHLGLTITYILKHLSLILGKISDSYVCVISLYVWLVVVIADVIILKYCDYTPLILVSSLNLTNSFGYPSNLPGTFCNSSIKHYYLSSIILG